MIGYFSFNKVLVITTLPLPEKLNRATALHTISRSSYLR